MSNTVSIELEYQWEVVHTKVDNTKPLGKIVEKYKQQLGLIGGKDLLDKCSIRNDDGFLEVTDYPEDGQRYILSVEHQEKA